MKIGEVLAKKQTSTLIAIRPEDTIETAATLLTSNKIGVLPVRDEDGHLIGILSERDIVRGIAHNGGRGASLGVASLMTTPVTTCSPDDEVGRVLASMHTRRFRHMPVLDTDGEMIGMISLGDLVKTQLEQAELEVSVLRDYAMASR